MIYSYYCTNCGHKIEDGRRIHFDLARILDLNSGQGGTERFIRFTPDDLRELVQRNGEVLKAGKKTRLELTLFDLLGFIAQDMERYEDREALQGLTYRQFSETTSLVNLMTSEDAGQNAEVIAASIQKLVDAITAKLVLKDKTDKEAEDEDWEQDTRNYAIYFWVEPLFFEGTEEIYSIRYSSEANPVNLNPFEFCREIRGYCPECNEPILDGAGRYEHILVGFLGAQSAGKTSLFIAMINDLPNHFGKLGVRLPTLLSDGKYEKINRAIEDNQHGWAIGKTDARAVVESFNASLLIEKEDKKIILTFVDIAGELCYDDKKKGVNLDAFKKFPLITACHMYMLCTCVSQRGYGEADSESASIPSTALLAIGNEIYRNLKEPMNVPPMCLVITKVDMAQETREDARKESNPFDKIMKTVKSRKNTRGKVAYEFLEQVEILSTLYETCSNPDILESLKWCCNTYENSKNMTYLSMLSCSALGMPGRKYDEGIHDYEKDGDTFNPIRLDMVWDWILKNLGVLPLAENYHLPCIPSYGEGYAVGDHTAYSVRTIYSSEEREENGRTDAVYQLYMNQSKLDEKLHRYRHEEASNIPVLGRLLRAAHEKERMDIIKTYLQGFQK